MSNRAEIVSSDLDASKRFYTALARPLGLTVIGSGDGFAVGQAGKGVVLRVTAKPKLVLVSDDFPETRPTMVSLEAEDTGEVKDFFRETIRAGGMDVTYPSQDADGGRYCARVYDPDGNCVECSSLVH